MAFNDRNFYVVRKSDGTTMNFFYETGMGIRCRSLNVNQWVGTKTYIKNALKNYSLIMLPNDEIYVLYQDFEGNVYMKNDYCTLPIFANNRINNYRVYVEGIAVYNSIHLFYSIYDRNQKKTTIFHQTVDGNMNLGRLEPIDQFEGNFSIPFIPYCQEDTLIVVYQKFNNDYLLGYKIFDMEHETWSNYCVIDKSNKPYGDYSVLILNKEINILFIKPQNDKFSLNCCKVMGEMMKDYIISEGYTIDTCGLFCFNNTLWAVWCDKDKLYGSFFMEKDQKFTDSPHCQIIDGFNIIKSIFITNYDSDMKNARTCEVYTSLVGGGQFYVLSDLQRLHNNMRERSFGGYYLKTLCERIVSYNEDNLTKKDMIDEFKNVIEQEKFKAANCEETIKQVRDFYKKFQEIKKELYETIQYYKKRVQEQEERIRNLEGNIYEKEKEILTLKTAMNSEPLKEKL